MGHYNCRRERASQLKALEESQWSNAPSSSAGVTAKLSCLPCMNEEASFAAPCDPHCVIKVQPVHKCLVCTLVLVAAKREGYPAASKSA